MKKQLRLTVFLAAAVLALSTTPVSAAGFPSKPITIVHGSSAGAPQDVMFHLLAKQMEKVFNQPVIVDARPGGTSQVAAVYVLSQPADGYTILSCGDGFQTTLLLPGHVLKRGEFTPFYRVQLDPFALYVKKNGKYGSLKALIKEMRAHPGSVRVGGYGATSAQRVAMASLADKAEVKFTWVPFPSGTRAIAATLGNNLDAALSNISVYKRFSDKAKVVGISVAKPLKNLPNIPTFKSQGYDVVLYHWRGLCVKNGTPKNVVDTLFSGIKEAIASPAYADYLARTSTLDGTMSQDDLKKFIDQGNQRTTRILKNVGLLH